MKKYLLLTAALAASVAAVPAFSADVPEIVTVVKITGINWFNRMEEGVVEFGKSGEAKTSQTGPATADVALQIKIVEDLIA